MGWESWIFSAPTSTIFYKANPHSGGKPTCFVAGLAQNTCVYGYRLVLYHLNFNISLLSRFVKPMRGIVDEFLLQPHHFLEKTFQYLREIDQFCGCSGPKYMYVWLQIYLILFESHHLFLERSTKLGMGITDKYLLQIHHILPSQSTCLRKTDNLCCCSGPKICVYGCRLVLHHSNFNIIS